MLPAACPNCKCTIPLHRGAGTDSNVFLVIYGDQNSSGEVRLENAPDNFSRNKTDVFCVDLPFLGSISQLRIGHDGKGNNPRWHLDRVLIANKTTKSPPLVFPCGVYSYCTATTYALHREVTCTECICRVHVPVTFTGVRQWLLPLDCGMHPTATLLL